LINRILFPILFFVIFFESVSYAQNPYNLDQFKNESFDFVKQPFRWENEDWLKLSAVSAGALILTQFDKSITNELDKERSYYNSFPIVGGKFWGGGIPTAFFVGVFGIHGLMADNNSSKKIAFEIVQASFYAGAITSILKISVGRARPFTNKGSGTFEPFTFFNDDFHSFPSGHATLAFSLSTVLAKNSKSDLLKVIAYIPAVLTCVSRVYQDDHWVSDVFAGAAIGYFVGDWVANTHLQKESPIQTSSLFPLAIRIKLD